ncbi:MAG: ABC transporter substrate-binding protein [Solirubrobacterales bacterium]
MRMSIRARSARLLLLPALLIAVVFLAACAKSSDDEEPNPDEQETITVGALLDLSDGWTTLGEASETTLRLAAEDANAFLASQGIDSRVELVIADVAGSPETTADEMRRLQDEGVNVFIGPQASSEVEAVIEIANDDDSVVISQGSTASALAEPGDNVFRFVPDDVQEARAVSALLAQDRISSLVPIWRDDLGNNGLHDSVTAAFQASGGEVLDGVQYGADTTDFADSVDELAAQVRDAIDRQGAERTGVYLAGFDEVADLLEEASGTGILSTVRWYGSDGAALIDTLIENETAAAYAERVGYPNPLLGLDPQSLRGAQDIIDRAASVDDSPPDAFALAAYDALQVAVRAWVSADGIDDLGAFKRNLILIADSYDGASGATTLNEAGDRLTGSYDFWAVCEGSDGFAWESVGTFVPRGVDEGGRLESGSCPS